jgi:amino acid adenylation domain-containing protein
LTHSGSAFYNLPGAVRLIGELNEAALRQTVNEIVRRHEALRTTFAMLDGVPVQVIAEQLEVPLTVIDLTELPATEREARAQQLAQAEAQTPFELSTGPLIRVRLLRLAATDQIVLFTLHHIVSDGWSMGVLVNEVAALYTAYVKNQPSPLPELPIQYADFAHWQRQWLSGDVLQQQLDYWTEQLSGSPTLLTLPTDRPRPIVQSHRGATLSFEVSAPTTAGLYALNKQTQTTLFMTLTAAFNVLLSRYAGQDDICIGTPIANRNRAEIEGLIGFFVNTLVLRTRVDSTAPFESLLQQVRTRTLDAYAHQDVPFEQLVETLKPERHTSHSPLFQAMLALQNAPTGSLDLPGLTLQAVASENTTAKFDLTLDVTEADGQLFTSFEYNTDLFDPATVERMAGHFTHLLEAVVANPSARIQDLPMLGADELHRLLVEWNATESEYPQDKCIHELFEAQVEKTPEAVAVVFEDRQLTYAELNARANQLAHYLQSLGVGPEVLVGICVERSLEMIVGLLGILKAGGAYVPLDPAYPPERLAYMLADARPAVLLTQTPLQSTLSADSFCLDSQWDALDSYDRGNPENITLPGHLAYVIYTSGSTGKPKGVLLKQAGLSNLVQAQVEAFSIQEPQRILQFASFNFDASTSEIFMTLSCGATLYLAARDDLMPGGKLDNTLQQLAINVVTLPPVALNGLSPAAFPRLETIIVAGEACPGSLVAQWAGAHDFFNAYGPTEATVCASIQRCYVEQVGPPPIGRPISNAQIYLLDSNLNLVPVGVPGELHISGVGLARGYLNRPDLTAEKFLPNPFSSIPGARMYRTGDLARYLPDGNLEFLGRIDHQVKIRGFRIELGEIEAALGALPEVREVVVLAREDTPGDKRLVAYLVPQAGHSLPETAELRSKLAQTLPEYMLPAHFMSLEQLPLTPNGKIDRKALPAPDLLRSEVGYVAPRTPTEETLAQIWAEVLKLDKVGIHDNFFELGGHSLLAVHLMTRIQQTFQYQIPLSSLFQSPTLAQFAVLVAERATPPWSPIVPIQPQGSRTPLFCIHEISGFASFYTDLAHQLDPDQPLYGLQARGLDKQQAPHTSINEMATCYREAIQQVQARGPYLLAGWSMGGTIAYEISQQLKQRGEEIAFLGLLDSYGLSDAPEPAENALIIEYLRETDPPIEHLDQMISETDEDIIPKALALAQKAKLMPPDLCLADFQRYLEVYKVNSHAAHTYQPQPYSGTATLFVCQEPPAEGIAVARANIDRWRGLVHNLELREASGNHSNMVKPPHVNHLAAEMSSCLRRVMNFHQS